MIMENGKLIIQKKTPQVGKIKTRKRSELRFTLPHVTKKIQSILHFAFTMP
jgi:hypothetical protein